jgi:hypothetical protein
LLGGQKRLAIHQNDVAANAELRRMLRVLYRLCKGAPSSHQCRGGHNAALVRLQDGAIDPGGKAKVVGVDDQAAHAASLTAKMRRQNQHKRHRGTEKGNLQNSSQKTPVRRNDGFGE